MLKTGMLWLDDDKRRSLEDKVRRAADYYERKYGRAPQVCLVNGKALAEALEVDEIKVRPAGHVLPSHLWLGIETLPN